MFVADEQNEAEPAESSAGAAMRLGGATKRLCVKMLRARTGAVRIRARGAARCARRSARMARTDWSPKLPTRDLAARSANAVASTKLDFKTKPNGTGGYDAFINSFDDATCAVNDR